MNVERGGGQNWQNVNLVSAVNCNGSYISKCYRETPQSGIIMRISILAGEQTHPGASGHWILVARRPFCVKKRPKRDFSIHLPYSLMPNGRKSY